MPINLPSLAEVEASRKGKPLVKPATRLQETVAEKQLTTVTEKDFRFAVWTRDKHHCRKCLRHVEKLVSRVPERGDVHHIHGRGKDLRFEARAALLLCCACHEQVTGKIGERWMIKGSKQFLMRDQYYIDASYPVEFIRL